MTWRHVQVWWRLRWHLRPGLVATKFGIQDRGYHLRARWALTLEKRMNTITPAQIDALLAGSTITDTKMGDKTTVVCVRLPNGFEVIESSGCVDPANYNHALGVDTCLRRIKDKLWMLEGYRLQSELHQR